MPISLTNYTSALQSKLDAVNSNTTPQDLLLISKSLQSTVGNVVVTDVQSAGTTQIGLSYYNSVVLGAPAALDTLDELAAALNDDANFASTVTTSLNARVTKSTLTAKGDILVATASATPAALPVGTNGTALLADSTQASGLRWGRLSDSGTQILSVMGAI